MLQQGSVVQTLDVIRGSLCPGDSFAAHEVPLDAMMESLGPHRNKWPWRQCQDDWERSTICVFLLTFSWGWLIQEVADEKQKMQLRELAVADFTLRSKWLICSSREVQNDLWLVTCFAQAASASFGIWNSFVEAQVVSAWYTSEAAEQPELFVVWRLLLPLKVQSVLQAGVTENVSLPFLCLDFCVAHGNTKCSLSTWLKIRSPF